MRAPKGDTTGLCPSGTARLVCHAWVEQDRVALDDPVVFCVAVANVGEEPVLVSTKMLSYAIPNNVFLTTPLGKTVGLFSLLLQFAEHEYAFQGFVPIPPRSIVGQVHVLWLPALRRTWEGEMFYPLVDLEDVTQWERKTARERFGDLGPGRYTLHAQLWSGGSEDPGVREHWGRDPWIGLVESNRVPFMVV